MTIDSLRHLRASATPLRDGLHGWNGMAIEREYAELIYALVRAERPVEVIETGTGEGRCSMFIATALQENGIGRLTTFETDPEYAAVARRNLRGLPADVVAEPWTLGRGPLCPQFVFIDSISPWRIPEIEHWLGRGCDATIVIHDANRDYPLHLGDGVLLTRGDGLWIGRGR